MLAGWWQWPHGARTSISKTFSYIFQGLAGAPGSISQTSRTQLLQLPPAYIIVPRFESTFYICHRLNILLNLIASGYSFQHLTSIDSTNRHAHPRGPFPQLCFAIAQPVRCGGGRGVRTIHSGLGGIGRKVVCVIVCVCRLRG